MEIVTFSIFVALLAIALTVALLKWKRYRRYPPGPFGVPVLGYLPFFGENPGATFLDMKAKYGSVISMRVGSTDWVVLNDYDAINEAFVRQADKFSGRPYNLFFRILSNGNGLLFSNHTPTWTKLRKTGQTVMRGYGVGKKSIEDRVSEEASFLLGNLTSANEFDLRTKLALAVSNVVSGVVFGSRFPYDDSDFQALLHFLDEFFSSSFKAKAIGLIMTVPYLRFFPVFRRIYKERVEEMREYKAVLDRLIQKQKSTYDSGDVRSLIDLFLFEIEKRSKAENGEAISSDNHTKSSDFFAQHLSHFSRELYEGGSAATRTTLLWAILTLAHYPEWQDKILGEIDSVVDRNETLKMSHAERMPYTQAFIQENMRHRTSGPLGGLLHMTSEDAELLGYRIPKYTTVVPNVWAVHHDPKHFKNPGQFRPERFIDGNGQFIKSKRVIPFLIGNRACIGQQLAKTEIFIFVTTIVQNLKILPHPGKVLPDLNEGCYNGITLESSDFDVVFERR